MKIVLINTRQEDFQKGLFAMGNSRKNQPLDLLLCATILKKQKHKVKIIDANLARLTHQQTAKLVKKERPDFIIANTAALDRWECPLPTVKQPILLVKELKRVLAEIKIALTGPHITADPVWVAKKIHRADILIKGEPELTIQDIGRQLPLNDQKLKKIPGLVFKSNKKFIDNPNRIFMTDLDKLPIPDYSLLPMEKYGPLSDHFNGPTLAGENHPFTIMLTSRGCPGLCVFCFKKMYQDKKTYRFRNNKMVVEEIKTLISKHGIKAVYFQDLSFCVIEKRVIDLCDLIVKNKLKINWGCEARFDNVSEKMIEAMKKAGCSFINFGLESGSQKILNLSKKNIQLKVIEEAIYFCQKHNVAAGCFKLLALPGETKETFIDTLKFMIKNKVEIPYPFPINLALPYPGTELHHLAEKQFKTKITYDNAPDFAGRIGTNFFDQVTLPQIQRLTFKYKLKQMGKTVNKHYLKLIFLEMKEKLIGRPKTF